MDISKYPDLQENKVDFWATSRSSLLVDHTDQQRRRKFRAVAEIGLGGRPNGAARPGGPVPEPGPGVTLLLAQIDIFQ